MKIFFLDLEKYKVKSNEFCTKPFLGYFYCMLFFILFLFSLSHLGRQLWTVYYNYLKYFLTKLKKPQFFMFVTPLLVFRSTRYVHFISSVSAHGKRALFYTTFSQTHWEWATAKIGQTIGSRWKLYSNLFPAEDNQIKKILTAKYCAKFFFNLNEFSDS